MADYNKIIMVGNLTRDPEYKQLPSGQGLCRLGLASNRQYRNRQTGAMVQEVCFVDIDVWGNQADSCRQYLQKGRAILVDGRLKFDTWQDNNGNTRSKHSIVADRVVFLSQAVSDEESVAPMRKSPSSDLEKELLDQIDKIKEKAAETIQDSPSNSVQAEASANTEKKGDDAVKPAKKVVTLRHDTDVSASADARAMSDKQDDRGSDAKDVAQNKRAKKKKSDDADKVNVAEFKDEPPFEDNLPF